MRNALVGLWFVLAAACGSAQMGVDDDPGTRDSDVGVGATADWSEGDFGIDVDVGDDDDPDDRGEQPDGRRAESDD